ncbi:hypothetical protein [Acinetobacter ursingii]|uniref:hypothetical protein n=1 Tax=Acinetobacter ursingii TaxID=108980 RepID=UPI0021CDE2E3|nr:hypothetical protein [Acinetobacter ursingii]MCU4604730.1 hypothetical protein [Acinetobacter ursingii]
MKMHQAGVTLISLLIGLLIAMFCILAVLTAYKTTVKSGVDSRLASTHDTQLQSGLTMTQMFLQNAGYGFESGNNILATTLQINSKNTKVIVWRVQENSVVTCQGIADIASDDNKKRKLVLISGFSDSAGAACNATANLGSFIWKADSTLATLEDFSTDQSNPSQISFTLENKVCTPFGATEESESVSHPYVTIAAGTSTQTIAGLEKVKVPVCIVNITS